MIDITDRKRRRAERAEAEARYRALVEQIPASPTSTRSTTAPTVYISPQTETIFGYAPEEWYADADLWSKIVHPEDRARLDAEPETDGATRVLLPGDREGRTRGVGPRSVDARSATTKGSPVYWQGVLVDVTEQRRTQELERDLERERDEAERLRAEDEMKTTFLQAVSHDLRTPLAAILGLAVTLERDDIDLAAGRDARPRPAHRARTRASSTDGRGLPRPRAAEPRARASRVFEPIDVGALVREIVANSDLVAGGASRSTSRRSRSRADAAMVERIVENLLGNTVKHTPGDSRIWVRAGAHRRRRAARRRGRRARRRPRTNAQRSSRRSARVPRRRRHVRLRRRARARRSVRRAARRPRLGARSATAAGPRSASRSPWEPATRDGPTELEPISRPGRARAEQPRVGLLLLREVQAQDRVQPVEHAAKVDQVLGRRALGRQVVEQRGEHAREVRDLDVRARHRWTSGPRRPSGSATTG